MKSVILLTTVEWSEDAKTFVASVKWPDAGISANKRSDDMARAIEGAMAALVMHHQTHMKKASLILRGNLKSTAHVLERVHPPPIPPQ